MIIIRRSPDSKSNKSLQGTTAKAGETNRAWLRRIGANRGIVLLRGASVAHFRIRTAQSHARADLAPSYWSIAGLLTGSETFLSVPLELTGDSSELALRNGVHECKLADYDDPRQFPNIAAFHFTADDAKIIQYANRVAEERSIIDLPTLMLPWLNFIWITNKSPNPLADGMGLPSAAFLETVYGIGGIELTPGVSSAASCPEVIWQSAKWWHSSATRCCCIPSERIPAFWCTWLARRFIPARFRFLFFTSTLDTSSRRCSPSAMNSRRPSAPASSCIATRKRLPTVRIL